MNHLISVRTNIIYSKSIDDEGKETYHKFNELIFLTDKPNYRYTNEGTVVRERIVEEFRFTVSEKGFDSLIDILKELRNADETEIEK